LWRSLIDRDGGLHHLVRWSEAMGRHSAEVRAMAAAN